MPIHGGSFELYIESGRIENGDSIFLHVGQNKTRGRNARSAIPMIPALQAALTAIAAARQILRARTPGTPGRGRG